MRKHLFLIFSLLLVLSLGLAACGGSEPTDAPQAPATNAPATEAPADTLDSPLPTPGGGALDSPLPTPEAGQVETLRMALLPVLDVLPFHVAAQNGYFDQVGVAVELVPVKSGQERDTLMQTGQVDGMLTDLISPVLFNQQGEQLKAVRTARRVYPDSPMFYLLAAPGSEAKTPADLAGQKIGIAKNTVIEYLTDRMLEKAGLAPDEIATEEVSAIPVRFELLLNGQIPAATLPDPLASGAIAAGAVNVVDDTSVPDLSQSILAFSTESLDAKADAVRRFLQAWEMAVNELNANPDAYHDLLIEKGRVPESIQGTFQMPPFPEASVPTPEQLADVLAWAIAKGTVANEVPYEQMVDDSFLP
jgi:NitT/TauT family transport system substrate-binding protein